MFLAPSSERAWKQLTPRSSKHTHPPGLGFSYHSPIKGLVGEMADPKTRAGSTQDEPEASDGARL